jgi:hypothetical protein
MRRILPLVGAVLLAVGLAGGTGLQAAGADGEVFEQQRAAQLGVPVPLMRVGGAGFQAELVIVGRLSGGVMGLPGESVTWVITLTNKGVLPGTDLLVTNTLRDELRVDDADADHGTVAVSGQTVIFTVPELQPGQTVTMRVRTTVLRGPANGVLVNQVILAGNGPAGPFTQSASADLFVPTGLPATGYPPADDLPGQGEPSVLAVGVGALLAVMAAAGFVWYRGRRELG